MRLSVKLTTGFADPRVDQTGRGHPFFPSQAHLVGKIFGDRAVESHISPKKRARYGAPKFRLGERLSDESRMQFINATGLHGKSEVAQWRDLRFSRGVPGPLKPDLDKSDGEDTISEDAT